MPKIIDGVHPDLSLIAGPADTPPTAPDDHTAKEIHHAEMLGKMTPTHRHIHAIERHLAECSLERSNLTAEVRSLRNDLDVLRPEYAALKESHRNVGANGTFSAVSTLLASTALALASFVPQTADWGKWLLIGGGIVGTGLSLWQSVKTRIWLWPESAKKK